jgi:hypothetical protein
VLALPQLENIASDFPLPHGFHRFHRWIGIQTARIERQKHQSGHAFSIGGSDEGLLCSL